MRSLLMMGISETMEIEIAEPGRMTQTGSSLLRLIQNNNMPVLDLFVREAIQNSLDARIEEADCVNVELIAGEFNADSFTGYLDMVGDSLKSLYPNGVYEYLAVRDSNTVGLTGNLHYDDVTDEKDYGNLLKLVYEISKAQDTEGAGGSWGLGKTVYFRIGIGLVLYYSRIKNGDDYQSRLAVSFVEDETSSNAVIPAYKRKLRRGIAWWGEKIGENKTQPITDESLINDILECFSATPYSQDETGTMVIIPYVDPTFLLKNNEMDYRDAGDNPISLYWKKSISEYLNVAVQRWYAPRLNNPNYPFGPYLHVYINGNPIDTGSMEPVFRIIQQLYNTAQSDSKDVPDGELDIKREEIHIRKALKTEIVGIATFVQVDRKVLHMNPPDNKPTPYMYINCDIKQAETNKSIICFTRKPGMIVSYRNVGDWADGLPESDPNHFIIALFVLNSANMLQQASDLSLEEYIRKSEMADHTDWNDYNIGDVNPRIVSKAQKQVISKIYKEFAPQEEQHEEKANSGLGKMFGDMLLPPESFGKKPSGKSGGQGKKGNSTAQGSLSIIAEDTVFNGNNMVYHLVVKPKDNNYMIDMGIDSENGFISVDEWKHKLGLKLPFELSEIYCSESGDRSKALVITNNLEVVKNESGQWSSVIDADSCITGIFKTGIKKNTDHYWISIKVIRRDVRPAFVLHEMEGGI